RAIVHCDQHGKDIPHPVDVHSSDTSIKGFHDSSPGITLNGEGDYVQVSAQRPCAKSAQLTLPCVLRGTIWGTKGRDRIGLGVGVKATKRSTTSCSRSPALQHGRISTGFHARGRAGSRS